MRAEFDNVLLPRDYTIDLGVHHYNGETHDFVQRTADFTVLKVAENGGDHFRWGPVRGYARIPVRWDLGMAVGTYDSGSAKQPHRRDPGTVVR